jgi:hypothetical protein
MTVELNGIVIDSDDTTVLSYSINTTPNPLQISSTGSITVVVYKGPPEVSCSSLTFTISKGSYDIDLTTDPSTITTSCPSGWSVTADGAGRFTFTPNPGNGTIGPDGLSFVFNNIAVNNDVGGTPLYIKEIVTPSGGQQQINAINVTLSKFPQSFAFQYFNVDHPSVAPGGSVTLSWSGSANSQNVTYDYSLSYNTTTFPNLPNAGHQVVNDLLETTVFTLNIAANGSAQYQQQVTVTVTQPQVGEFGIVGNPTKVLIGSSFQLYWQTVNADHCNLSINGVPTDSNLPANMSEAPGFPVTAPSTPGTYSYALTAIGSDGKGGPSSTLQILVYEPPVQILSFGIVGDPIEAVAGSTVQLYWSTQGATQCELVFNGTTVASNLPATSQGYPFTLPDTPGTASFVLSAYYNQVPVSSSNLSVSLFPFQFVTAIDDIPPSNFQSVQMLASPDGSQVYLLDAGGSLTVIDTATYTPRPNPINNVASGSLPSGLCSTLMSLSPDGSYLYFACGSTDGGAQIVNVVDTLTWNIRAITIPVQPGGSVICGVAMSSPPSNYLVVSSAMIASSSTTPQAYDGPSTLYVLEPSNNYNLAVTMEAGNNVFFSGLATATQSPGTDVFCVGASMESAGTPSNPCVYSFEIKGAALNPVNLPNDFGAISSCEIFITSPGYAANYASFASLLDPSNPQFFGADTTILSTTCSVDGKYLYYGGVYLPTDYGNGARIARIPTNAPGHFTTLYTYDDMPPGEEILVNVNAITVSHDGKYLYAAVDTITPIGGGNFEVATQVLVFNFP